MRQKNCLSVAKTPNQDESCTHRESSSKRRITVAIWNEDNKELSVFMVQNGLLLFASPYKSASGNTLARNTAEMCSKRVENEMGVGL